MDVPIGWQETKLPLNPDTRKLAKWLKKQYEDSSGPDEKNFQIQRRGQDRVFLISRKELKQDEIRNAATKGLKLPVSQPNPSSAIPKVATTEPKSTNMLAAEETAEPGLIPETHESPIATYTTHPDRSVSLKPTPPARRYSFKRSASNTWNVVRGLARNRWLGTGITQRDT